jgi:GH3 auxin-responsive promoter
LIEFEKEPSSLETFTKELDTALKSINSDYEAKRHKSIALSPPVIHSLKKGTFTEWLRSKGKLGGQHKVPRLSNERQYVEEILSFHN